MKILVLGGTGTVGSNVVQELLARDAEEVRVLTRDAQKAKHLPAGVVGDLNEPDTVRSVFRGIDGVFLLNLGTPTETFEGLMALNSARLSGVQRLVYLSIHDIEAAPHVPHVGPKIAIEAAIKASGMAYTVLRANNFYQNDYWFKDTLLRDGLYPQPIGDLGVSRVDVRDVAEAAAIALTTGRHDGQTYDLIGPDVHTGQSTADIWSRALGRPVQYGGNDLDRWEQQSLGFMPAWLVFDYKIMYGFFQAHGLIATADDVERLSRLLRHAPRSFEDFATETAGVWRAETGT